MISIGMMAGGLLLLFLGGEMLLKGSVSLARNLGLSTLLVSAVIVGFGTSMPEMTVSVGAALKESPDIALGNVIGSNIANILLIVGISACIAPLVVPAASIRRDAIAMMAAAISLMGAMAAGTLGAATGVLMLLMLSLYLGWCYRQDKNKLSKTAAHIEQDIEGKHIFSLKKAALFSVIGLVLLVGGASLLVEGAIAIARNFGISEAVIGLTIVAVGTSLPELATAVIASRHRHSDVIIGNILGSNLFNILGILGVTSLIHPIRASPQMHTDFWIMLAATAFLTLLLWLGIRMGRLWGAAMLATYATYTVWLYAL